MIAVPVGQAITLTATFTDEAGYAADPALAELDITTPAGVTTTIPYGTLEHPSVGVFSFVFLPPAPGRWTYEFRATAGILAAVAGAFSVEPADWAPTVDAIGAELRARTVDENGNELGTFTLDTRPTTAQVLSIIAQEVGALSAFIGYDLPTGIWPLARKVAVLRVAVEVERTYFPEQINAGRDAYEQLVAERDAEMGRLVSAVRATGVAEGGGRNSGSIPTRPRWARDSETPLLVDDDIPPFTPSAWPVGGAAGTSV